MRAGAEQLRPAVGLVQIEAEFYFALNQVTEFVKPWVGVGDFGPAQAEINQEVVEKLKAAGISIPYPQHEIRVLGNSPLRSAA